jgi:hypothetical protein
MNARRLLHFAHVVYEIESKAHETSDHATFTKASKLLSKIFAMLKQRRPDLY